MDYVHLVQIVNSSTDLHKIVPNFPLFIGRSVFCWFVNFISKSPVHLLHDYTQVVAGGSPNPDTLHNEPWVYNKVNTNLIYDHIQVLFLVFYGFCLFMQSFFYFLLFYSRFVFLLVFIINFIVFSSDFYCWRENFNDKFLLIILCFGKSPLIQRLFLR